MCTFEAEDDTLRLNFQKMKVAYQCEEQHIENIKHFVTKFSQSKNE